MAGSCPTHPRRHWLLASIGLSGCVLAALTALPPVSATAAAELGSATSTLPDAPKSSFFSTASIEEHETVGTTSNGDLWPSCWSNDGNLYSANGDGKGFSVNAPVADIAVNLIRGTPPHLTGQTLAHGKAISSIWSGSNYNRKPTGMVCVNGVIYLAVQDLALDFDDAPAATVVKSTDHGRTWTWDRSKPMFDNYVFTTIWFADFGKDSAWAPDGYVYAYGLDNNWRKSTNNKVLDPADVYLARVPREAVQNRAAWDFYAGIGGSGKPRWTHDITARAPILHDGRRIYRTLYSSCPFRDLTVIGQGGVAYDQPLKRYLYTSWSEYTFEFYESPTPWGPWRHFLSKDFGSYPWFKNKHGGYATTAPTKFFSADGLSMWIQTNVAYVSAGASIYHYSLRKLYLTLPELRAPNNIPDTSVNLANPPTGAVPISKSARFGHLQALNDQLLTDSEDDFDNEAKSASWWGYTWPRRYHLNRVDFTSGEIFSDGGWFVGQPRVQLRQNGQWVDAAAQTISPPYPGNATAGAYRTYAITFMPADADGVRVIGTPGGSRTFTSVAEVAARYTCRFPGSRPSRCGQPGAAAEGANPV